MQQPLDAILRDPWQILGMVLDGPLHPGGREATETLLDRAGVDEQTRLLDIGCGAGDSLHVARERGARAIGLDREPPGTDAVCGDISALPFRDDSFDVVLGECVLCLSPALDQTLGDVNRILHAGGQLALSDVTVTGDTPDLPPPIDELLCLDGPRDRDDICQEIASAGFEIDDVQTHREDLLEMRDRLREALDLDRLVDVLGDRGTQLRDGASQLETAIEAGQVGYVSIVATSQS
ncbi:class I SAM-dependent methyltransferase [Halorarius halobius]|uniref:class I SAM-dependent methyltransferase n=1 Tax=Halorarius halobius TaxID=2962671 RepID=UPI0020CDDD73|nr:methyltransferase domain-containing protein [Halorarius halobius]